MNSEWERNNSDREKMREKSNLGITLVGNTLGFEERGREGETLVDCS